MNITPVRLVISLLILILALMLVTNLRPVERVINEGPTLEVRRNAFYAAGQFIEQQGIPVEHRLHPVDIDRLPVDDTLLLSDVSYLDGDYDQAYALLDWVESGGHLIWQHRDNADADPLAEILGVATRRVEHSNRKKGKGDSPDPVEELVRSVQPTGEAELSPTERVRQDIEKREREADSDKVSWFQPNDGVRLASLSYPDITLSQNQEVADGDYPVELTAESFSERGVEMMFFRLGRGEITVVSDAWIWSNNRIGLFDHAQLLQWLTRGSSTLHIQRYTTWPSLLTLIVEYAIEPAIVVLLLLLAWLLSRGRRFGPVLQVTSGQRRSLREHVEAVAHFHHQYRQHNVLLAPLRRQIVRRAGRQHANIETMADAARNAIIAEQTNLDLALVSRAMREEEHYTPSDLVEIVQLLINIRNQL